MANRRDVVAGAAISVLAGLGSKLAAAPTMDRSNVMAGRGMPFLTAETLRAVLNDPRTSREYGRALSAAPQEFFRSRFRLTPYQTEVVAGLSSRMLLQIKQIGEVLSNGGTISSLNFLGSGEDSSGQPQGKTKQIDVDIGFDPITIGLKFKF